MTEQAELDQLAEAEFEKLQKQFRLLQSEIKGFQEEKILLQKKQKKLISVLQREHEMLKNEIQTIKQGTHAKKESEDDAKLKETMKEFSEKQKELDEEKINLQELEGHIKKIEKETDTLRKNEVTDMLYKENLTKTHMEVVKLENRLDVANKKCSDVLTENAKLRQFIDYMLKDRAHFNDVWQALVNQFNEGKKYIMDLIDQSTLAYDQREELCNKLQTLKERNESDKLLHVQEMRELQRKLEHDAKLQEFYDIKGQRRINTELEARANNKRLQQKEGFEKQLREYKEIISKIQEDDIEKLAAQFTTQEEENFALFNYVNELSHEVEILNDVVQQINDEIEKQKSDQAENEFKRRTENIPYLQQQMAIGKKKADEAAELKEACDQRLQHLLEGIEKLFKLVHWNDVPILSVLGSKNFLTVYNVKLYLGVIGKRINVITSDISDEETMKILAKRDRIPKFNVKESVKVKP